jgi:D-alanyl-D-alanine carboxypeptidase (penicillin-binding protein 5/6)
VAVAGVVLVAIAAALVAVAPLTRRVPPPMVTVALPAAVTLPGAVPVLPWPRTGQAAVAVAGIGRVGTSGAGRPVPIASVTKAMTAYAILLGHPLRVGEQGPALTVTAAQAAAYQVEASRSESLIPVRAGAVFTERQALQALMLPSANNMARILGAWDAGSVEAFVARMNATAAALGMRDTRYTDPSGLDPATVSTAADQVTLGLAAMRLPAFADIVAQTGATVPVAGWVHNSNRLLGRDGVVGIKTGSTTQAGGCLLFAVRVAVAGRAVTIVGAVLSQPGIGSGPQLTSVFAAARRLIQAVPKILATYTVIRAGKPVVVVRGPLGTGTTLNAVADLSLLGWPGLTVALVADVPPLPPALHAGSLLGRLSLLTGAGADQQPISTALRSGEELARIGAWRRMTERP